MLQWGHSSMANEWLRSLLVLLVVAASFDFTNGQHCQFTDSWTGPWWTRNVPGTKSRTFITYGLTSEIHFQQTDFVNGRLTSILTCKEDYTLNNLQRYYFINPSGVAGDKNHVCTSLYKDPGDKILIHTLKDTGSNDNTPRVCVNLEYPRHPHFLFKYPLDYVETCPFRYNRYNITVRRGVDPGPMCESGNYTIHMNRAIGEMTIHSCFSENLYTAPFENAKLKCVGDVLPIYISSTYHKGSVFFFAYTSKEGEVDAGMTNIYTARYLEAENGTVLMSLQGSISGRVRPDGNKDYKSFGAVDAHEDFSFAFVLKPTCPDIPCRNGGTCQGYTCLCGTEFKGTFCETNSECIPDPCNSHGVCSDLPEGFSCYCGPGYAGDTCEIDFDDCPENPCSGRGRCVDLDNDYFCECEEGYFGSTCQYVNNCEDFECSGHGDCVDENNDYELECRCNDEYYGDNCEHMKHCPGVNCSGHGVCLEVDGEDAYYCRCDVNYVGKNCQYSLTSSVTVTTQRTTSTTTTAVPTSTTKSSTSVATSSTTTNTTSSTSFTTSAVPVTITSSTSVTTSAVPVTTTSSTSVTTSSVPVTTTSVPATTSSVPVTTSSEPVTTSSVPVTTSAVLATTSSVPVTTSSVPVTTSAVPATTSAVPATTSAVPATTSAAPATTSAVPATASAVPVTTSSVPITTTTPSTARITTSSPSTTTSRRGGGGGGGTPSVRASTTQNIVIGTSAATDSNKAGPEAQRGDGVDVTTAIVGIVVAVLAVLIILAIVAYSVLTRRNKVANHPEDEDSISINYLADM